MLVLVASGRKFVKSDEYRDTIVLQDGFVFNKCKEWRIYTEYYIWYYIMKYGCYQ
jgi:hypothetical protein